MTHILESFIIFAVTPIGFITLMSLLILSEYLIGRSIVKNILSYSTPSLQPEVVSKKIHVNIQEIPNIKVDKPISIS